MAKRIAIVYSDEAFSDIDRIIEFNDLRNKSTAYSKKFVSELRKRIIKLSKQPLSGIKTDMEELLLVWDKYYIFYLFNGTSIYIKAIYHQKENVTR